MHYICLDYKIERDYGSKVAFIGAFGNIGFIETVT